MSPPCPAPRRRAAGQPPAARRAAALALAAPLCLCLGRAALPALVAPRPGARAAAAGAAGAEGAVDSGLVVAVAGATGRTGRLVVRELLQSGRASQVLALVRNETKAAEVLPGGDDAERVLVYPCAGSCAKVAEALRAEREIDAVIWCAEGADGLVELSQALKRDSGPPRLIYCSSAAVTRPTWRAPKRHRFPGAADIPIVRLNPNDILGKKRETEELVRRLGKPYAIVRPTGLSENWPPGRPLLSQGDFAVGRTSRPDLAALLVALLREPGATGKTFEMLSVAGYPRPSGGYGKALQPLLKDSERGPLGGLRRAMRRLWEGSAAGEDATYGLLQQLLPGEAQESAGLAMGQTYEQYDRGQEGRLGPRGQERVPASITG